MTSHTHLRYMADMLSKANDDTKAKIMSAVPAQFGITYEHPGHLVTLFDRFLAELQRITKMPEESMEDASKPLA